MRDEIVAIDLETTGLDPTKDDIIEIGAVRMKDGKVIDEFSTFVNPGSPIPANVSHITGIFPPDVVGAPDIQTLLPKISTFIGDSPIVAHNLSLDMGFLQQRYGILRGNTRIDTYDLASVMVPNAPRYNLHSLSQEAGITLENAHRALEDARAAGLLYWWLWQKVLTLPHGTLQEIISASRDLDWDASAVFTAALKESKTSTRDQQAASNGNIFPSFNDDVQPLHPHEHHQKVDVATATALVDEGGKLAQTLPDYEQRPQQIEMTRAITEAFNDGHPLLVEAGTGAGKSIAYLIPSILWSTTNDERVVISTYTLNLQDQLINKDLPILRAALKMNFTVAVMKGRSNYLCPRRLATSRRRPPTSVVELRTLAKILVWLLESKTGDRGEINLRGPVENTVWQRLSAQDEGCTLNRCETSMRGICPFYKARKAAETAHLVIVNHALLIADAMTENRVLPNYRYAIIDEAHQLEDATTSSLTFHIDAQALSRRLADLGNANRGLLGELLQTVRGHASEKEQRKLDAFVGAISEATTLMDVHVQRFFENTYNFLLEAGGGRSEYVTLIRIDHAGRSKNTFSRLQSAWNTLDEFFEVISIAMYRLTGVLGKMSQLNIPGYDDLSSSTETAARYLEEIRTQLKRFAVEADTNFVYWAGVGAGSDNPTIHAAPIHIGSMMEKYLWNEKESVILTSATLRSNENFDFIQDRLHATSVKTLEVGSPFNYRESTLIYVPNDIPEPNDRQGYQKALERGIIDLATALDGRVLVLFTSYTQLRQTSQAITPRLALGNIAVYDQSEGSNRQTLLDGFKSNQKAVLMGTKSFWEGIDIPGDSLSALIITRLPFAVPTDPIFAARSDSYSDSFNDYALPDAILRFRQGFRRLIRTRTDRGVVTIFDSRIINKRYGASFLEALPDCTTRSGTLDMLASAAKNWIDQPKS